MRSSSLVSSASLALVFVAAGSVSAHADDSSPSVAREETTAAPAPFMLSTNVGYQFSSRDSLTGLVDSFVFGIQVRSNAARRRDFIELGVSQLHVDDSDALPSSYLLVGARSAWSWNRFGLHLFGHFRHGDPVTSGTFTTSSQSASAGLLASFDVWRRSYLSLAIGLHATGNLVESLEDGDRSLATSGSTGLSIIAW